MNIKILHFADHVEIWNEILTPILSYVAWNLNDNDEIELLITYLIIYDKIVKKLYKDVKLQGFLFQGNINNYSFI